MSKNISFLGLQAKFLQKSVAFRKILLTLPSKMVNLFHQGEDFMYLSINVF